MSKKIGFKDIHEAVDIGRSHSSAHSSSLYLEVIVVVECEVVSG